MSVIQFIGDIRSVQFGAFEVEILHRGAEAVGGVGAGEVLRAACLGGGEKGAAEEGEVGGELDGLVGGGVLGSEEGWGCGVEGLDATE